MDKKMEEIVKELEDFMDSQYKAIDSVVESVYNKIDNTFKDGKINVLLKGKIKDYLISTR